MQKLKRAVIKEELVAVTGNWKQALVLNQLLYWTERVGPERYDKWLEEESNRQPGDTEDLEGGWIYKKANELKKELMINESERTVRNWLNELVEKGFINKRKNPDNKFDKTNQYRINAIQLIINLEKEGYTLEGYKYDELLRSLSHEKRNNFRSERNDFRSYSENTTETTSENTSNSNDKFEEEERARSSTNNNKNSNIEINNTSKSNNDMKVKKININTEIKTKYEQIFQRELSSEFYQKITKLYSDPKIIMKALEVAEENGDKPSYLLKLLSDWQENGLTSISSINTYLEERHSNNGNKEQYKEHIKNRSIEEMKEDGWR